ncbi:zinc knuckle domain protein [Penicillium daleae]|uniref:Zinc knuckle domain protein n=1 Tax=Penicillium daleae TaxID=63821 RepID=A0AAD6C8V3_9EURO|nr:zinc knuckle domain protein [Penicillium daleae]KAJ5455490.1 zinc knuckle domain protein [Penicillium daleae]
MPASIRSSDRIAIPFSVQQQFQQQEIDRARMSQQHQQARQEELTDEEFLMQQAGEWQDHCWICAQEGHDAEHELYLCEMAVLVATGANAQKLPPDRKGPPKTTVPRSMDDIAEGARQVLNHIENNGTEDRYVTGYIRAVRQYALNAQRGDVMGMAKVLDALIKINADTERLNQRMTTIEASTSNLSRSLSSLPADSAAAGLATASAPNTWSNGTSSPGVPEIELREDREVIVKVGANREQIRTLSPKELVERAERQRTTVARQKNSTALAGGASFVAARKLTSGDVAMVANTAAGAELLRKHTEWSRAFGPGSIVQEPSWGVVAYNIPVRSMKLTPETMADVARELLAQNDWGEAARIQFLGWLTRPGARAEGSILIEFTSPAVANRAIITGIVWGKQIHHAVRFCREGRTKLCRKCQKPGHIQSHCSNDFKCGHCADGHPTWECPSTKGQTIPVKCSNCGGGHRPTSQDCAVKRTAMTEAKQALLDSPTYHRVPLQYRNAMRNGNTTTTLATSGPTEGNELDMSIHATGARQEEEQPQHPQPVTVDLVNLEMEPPREMVPPIMEAPSAEPGQHEKPRRGPGRPKGSRTRPRNQAQPAADNTPLAVNRMSTRSQAASQKATQEHNMSKKRRVGEPEDTMDEQPDGSNWFDIHLPQTDPAQASTQQDDRFEQALTQFTNDVTTINDTNTLEPSLQGLDPNSPEYRKLITLRHNQTHLVSVGSSPPVFTTDAPTIEDPNDDIWHETSELIDDQQHNQ